MKDNTNCQDYTQVFGLVWFLFCLGLFLFFPDNLFVAVLEFTLDLKLRDLPVPDS